MVKIQILGRICFNEPMTGEKNNAGKSSQEMAKKIQLTLSKERNHEISRLINREVFGEASGLIDRIRIKPDNPVMMTSGIVWTSLRSRKRPR